MLITSENFKALNKSLVTRYNVAASAYTPTSNKIAAKVSSPKGTNVYRWLGTFPVFKKFTGESKIESLDSSDFQVATDEWDVTVGIPRRDIERDDIATHAMTIAGLGRRGSQLPDKLTFDLLAAGFTGKDYTGKNFFDTNKKHTPHKAGTFTNKGTQVLAASSLKAGISALRSLKDPEGYPITVGTKLLLVVSEENSWTAEELLMKEKDAYGADNMLRGKADLLVSEWLSGPAWFLIAHDETNPALIYQEELAPGIVALTGPTSEHWLLQKEALFNGYGRATAGYGMPQKAYGSTGVDPIEEED